MVNIYSHYKGLYMDYTINTSALTPLIEEEVAHVADLAYGENGISLYESIFISGKDSGLVQRFIKDAVNYLQRETADISAAGTNKISFDVPDMPSANSTVITEEITRFITMFASNGFFKQRRAAVVPEYTTRIQAALDNIQTLLRERTAPTRS